MVKRGGTNDGAEAVGGAETVEGADGADGADPRAVDGAAPAASSTTAPREAWVNGRGTGPN